MGIWLQLFGVVDPAAIELRGERLVVVAGGAGSEGSEEEAEEGEGSEEEAEEGESEWSGTEEG